MRAPPDDLYELLGVSPAATTAELRRAYRRHAHEHHPERAGPASAPRFAQIAEAYRMLSDPTARSAYDAHRLEREPAVGAPELGRGRRRRHAEQLVQIVRRRAHPVSLAGQRAAVPSSA